jgi:hypothetical protein
MGRSGPMSRTLAITLRNEHEHEGENGKERLPA